MGIGDSRINKRGYRILRIDGVEKKYSHYVWYQNTGYWPDWENRREIVHHINFDKLDNRFENLQLMTDSEHVSLHVTKWHETHDQLGENNPMYGRTGELSPIYGENNLQYGKTGSLSPNWISGPVCYSTQRGRISRSKRRIAEGRGTEEDIQLIERSED